MTYLLAFIDHIRSLWKRTGQGTENSLPSPHRRWGERGRVR
jgi:hypothetical protein